MPTSVLKTLRGYRRVVGISGVCQLIAAKAMGRQAVVPLVPVPGAAAVYLRVPSSDAAACRQVFFDGEYDFVSEREPAVIVDAGANIGLASVYFANKYPRARIIAIEPERDNFELLLRNVSPYPQVTCIQAALWNEEGEISVVDPGLGSWGFMTEAVGQTSTEHRHSVRAVTIESLRRDLSLETIDILKVDIEGAEREVFSSAAGWITDVNAVIAELHEHMRPGASRRFYLATEGFPREWTQGENIYLSREGWLLPPPSLKPEGS